MEESEEKGEVSKRTKGKKEERRREGGTDASPQPPRSRVDGCGSESRSYDLRSSDGASVESAHHGGDIEIDGVGDQELIEEGDEWVIWREHRVDSSLIAGIVAVEDGGKIEAARGGGEEPVEESEDGVVGDQHRLDSRDRSFEGEVDGVRDVELVGGSDQEEVDEGDDGMLRDEFPPRLDKGVELVAVEDE